MASISIALNDRVASVLLDRPDVHNAFDDGLIAELTAALQQLDADPTVRAVVLGGVGKSFSAGADLGWMRRMAGASETENRVDSLRLAGLMRTLNELSKPTIARVNGAAYGGGVGLIACCDIAIGTDSARFGLTETKLGLVPAVISPYVIAAIGARQARRLFLTAEIFDAAEAVRIGLLHRAVPAEQLDSVISAELDRLRVAGPLALTEAKRLVAKVAEAIDGPQLDADNAALIARLRVSAEGQEGLTAFFEKRPALWISENPSC